MKILMYANKRRLIITEDKYNQIVATLQKFSDPENSALKKTKDDFNTLSRFSIRTENSIAVPKFPIMWLKMILYVS